MASTKDWGHRELIECYHSLLTKNLILTDNFFRTLVTHGVFSEPLANDIKKLPAYERATKLIDLVMTRTATGFRKFVDVLEVTGHHFLSDCLREAENYEPIKDVDVQDLANRLPFISKSLKTDQQRQAVRQFFKEAIQKEVVKHTWKGDMQTKEQLILSRQKQIEQLWQFEEEEKIREKSMQELQENYLHLQEYADDLRRETKSLQKHIEDLHKKQREELKAQVDFNMANDRQLTRLNEKAEDSGSILDNLHAELKKTMDSDYQSKQAISDYKNLENNFKVFCNQYQEMASLVDHFRVERHYMSNQVAGLVIPDKFDFKAEFRNYVLKNEEELSALRGEISKLEEGVSIKNKKIKELEAALKRLEVGETIIDPNAAKLAELQKENEENRLKIIAKDDHILKLEKQLKALNDKFKLLERSLRESMQNEQHINDAVAAAKHAKNGNHNGSSSTNQVARGFEESRSDSAEKVTPGPPPPTQQSKPLKLRNKSFDSGHTSNAYQQKKNNQPRPVYFMDETAEISEDTPSPAEKSLLPDPSKLKQVPGLSSKALSVGQPTSTNHSRRQAAAKALKQSKGNGVPAALLKMK
ncbi:uncharacterized protein [Watersipora subatra]|uniref:uncharacterized protein n=1 Tax=Watersipora subatra TaxID=2589382 RepID=UPI00355B43CF